MKALIRLGILAPWLLGGCATLSPQAGQDEVDAIYQRFSGQPWSIAANASSAVPAPDRALDDRDLMQLALLNHPDFRAIRARLQLAAAARFDLSRLENPGFAYTDAEVNDGGLNLLGLSVHLPLARWLLAPLRREQADLQWRAATERLAQAMHERLLAVTRARLHLALAERELLIRAAEADAADTARALARRLYDAGNLSYAELLDQRIEAAETEISRLKADQKRATAVLDLAALVGLDSTQLAEVDLTIRLPEPTAALSDPTVLARWRDTPLLRSAQALHAWRSHQAGMAPFSLFESIGAEYERERESDGAVSRGYTWSWDVPLFRQGQDQRLARQARSDLAEAELRRLERALEDRVVAALSERESLRQRIDLYRQELLPSHHARLQERGRSYAFMLEGVFEWLNARRAHYRAQRAYVEAVVEHLKRGLELTRLTGIRLDQAGEALPAADIPSVEPTPTQPGAQP